MERQSYCRLTLHLREKRKNKNQNKQNKTKNKQNKILSFLLNHLFLPIQSDVLILALSVHQLWGLPHTASPSEVIESIWRVSAELYGLPKEAVSFGWYQNTCGFMDRSRYLFLTPFISLVLIGYQRILLHWPPLYPKGFSSNNNNKHNTVKESEKINLKIGGLVSRYCHQENSKVLSYALCFSGKDQHLPFAPASTSISLLHFQNQLPLKVNNCFCWTLTQQFFNELSITHCP